MYAVYLHLLFIFQVKLYNRWRQTVFRPCIKIQVYYTGKKNNSSVI